MPAELPALRAAALIDGPDGAGSRLLVETTRALQAAGWSVRGLLPLAPQHSRYAASHGQACMVLVDAHSGEEYLVSQAMGQQARACRADPQGFARASEALRWPPGVRPDLVVTNRWGRLESEGAGFTGELLGLLGDGLPLLTVVPERLGAAWQAFTGGAPLLPANPTALQAWLDTLPRR